MFFIKYVFIPKVLSAKHVFRVKTYFIDNTFSIILPAFRCLAGRVLFLPFGLSVPSILLRCARQGLSKRMGGRCSGA